MRSRVLTLVAALKVFPAYRRSWKQLGVVGPGQSQGPADVLEVDHKIHQDVYGATPPGAPTGEGCRPDKRP